MKRYLKGFYLALGMFCAIPLPVHLWDDSCFDLAMPCFPLVGALIGGMWWGIAELLLLSGTPVILRSAVLTVLPFLLTGFLHLDGFMDTSDAVLSRRPLEEKQRILKDPHTGSFAVIMLAVLFVLQFAAMFAATERGDSLRLLPVITVTARCVAAASILWLRVIPQSSYANRFRENTGTAHKVFVFFIALCAVVFSFFSAGIRGLIVTAAVMSGCGGSMGYAYKSLGGISGDLAGFSIVVGEMCGLAALAVL